MGGATRTGQRWQEQAAEGRRPEGQKADFPFSIFHLSFFIFHF
jgi:hypothetical protein